DGPYTAGGGAVVDDFTALVTASVTFSPQESAGETITVESVTLADGGFVTIHDATLLEGEALGSVRGTSEYLPPGTHTNVTVTLDEPITENATLIAMPHRDTDGDQTYDFVTSEGTTDAPYVAGGAVVAAANVTYTGTMDTATPTPTATPTDTPTASPTPSPTDSPTTESPGGGTTTTTTDTGSPGFTVVLAVLALFGVAALAVRRQH
ncbi:MAG: PGF-CTERM sorting domain-containing protein, partial [Halobaculum sp.]